MNILLEGLGSSAIWVEFTDENIMFLHEKFSASESNPKKKGRTSSGDKQKKKDEDADKEPEEEGVEE